MESSDCSSDIYCYCLVRPQHIWHVLHVRFSFVRKEEKKTEKKLATSQGLILPYVLFPEAKLANVIFKIKGPSNATSGSLKGLVHS